MAFVAVIVSIEILLLGMWIFALTEKKDVSAGQYGRVKMFLQFIVIMIWLTSLIIQKNFRFPIFDYAMYFANFLMLITTYFAAKSLQGYLRRYNLT